MADFANIDHDTDKADHVNANHDHNSKPPRTVKKPTWLTDYDTALVKDSNKVFYPTTNQVSYTHLSVQHQAIVIAPDTQAHPSSFEQAAKSQVWSNARNVELQVLERNSTWSITKLPPRKKAIGCKWLFKTKFSSDGTIERHKSRLVIQGCRQ